MPAVRSQLFSWIGPLLTLATVFSPSLVRAQDDGPRALDRRLKIELFAEAPQIVTPTGIDVDPSGRVWAIESNTHFPPENYSGHPSDRVLVMQDTDGDGKSDSIVVFKDGLTHTMSLAIRPAWIDDHQFEEKLQGTPPKFEQTSPQPSITVFIATRREILLCVDRDGDMKCDDVTRLIHLETSGNYPHNGLAGFAFDASGNMYFGFGENLGADYKIIGRDGTTLTGGGEGGNVYRCRPDGSKLERWATGFWNPHASCFDGFGHLFTVDNDPDSRPPCRLLHTVRDGDYGYRFRNGRKGTHPFTSWNGEILGTLPMVSGTGEAPSGIVCYESEGFPADYQGTLLVGSWGDHRIDQFVLRPRGVSFESIPKPFIKGGENFRPVGLAIAPDGSLYFSDWVSKEYKLHGQGRIWRVSANGENPRAIRSVEHQSAPPGIDQLIKLLDSPVLSKRRLAARTLARTKTGQNELARILRESSDNPVSRRNFEIQAATVAMGEAPRQALNWDQVDLQDPFQMSDTIRRIVSIQPEPNHLTEELVRSSDLPANDPKTRSQRELRGIANLLAARRLYPRNESLAEIGLQDRSPQMRRLAVQWAGEEQLNSLRPAVESVMGSEPMTQDLFMSCLATLSLFDGLPPAEFEKNPPSKYLFSIVADATRSGSLRAMALGMISPSLPELSASFYRDLLSSNEQALRRQAVRLLSISSIPQREELLREVARDPQHDVTTRADAVGGLPSSKELPDQTRELLVQIAANDAPLTLRREAIRSLRGPVGSVPAPETMNILRELKSKITTEPESTHHRLLIQWLDDAIKMSAARPDMQAYSDAALIDDSVTDVDPLGSGRRVFFRANGAGCYKCHTVSGQGGHIGPDLTVIARTMDRPKLAESVLHPSREISPQFTTWTLETVEGKAISGMLLGEEINGDLRLGNQQGEIVLIPFNQIESRRPLKISVMPEKLQETMTTDEFRDLILYLESLK